MPAEWTSVIPSKSLELSLADGPSGKCEILFDFFWKQNKENVIEMLNGSNEHILNV